MCGNGAVDSGMGQFEMISIVGLVREIKADYDFIDNPQTSEKRASKRFAEVTAKEARLLKCLSGYVRRQTKLCCNETLAVSELLADDLDEVSLQRFKRKLWATWLNLRHIQLAT